MWDRQLAIRSKLTSEVQPTRPVKQPLSLTWVSEMQPRLFAGGTLIKGFLDAGAMSVMYAPSNVGKSFLALDIAFHIAADRDWRGKKIKTPGCVLYLAAEGGFGIVNRVVALKRELEILDDEDFPLAVLPFTIDLLNPAADCERIVELIEQAKQHTDRPVVFIVIDTLSRVIAGGDENGPQDMTKFISNVDRIRAASGAHCMIVHHAGKDVAKGARGHSSLRAATDTEIELARAGEGSDKRFSVSVKKQRDMQGDEIFYCGLRTVFLGLNDEDEPVTSAVVEHLEDGKPTNRTPLKNELTKPKTEKDQHLDFLKNLIVEKGEEKFVPDHIPDGACVVTLKAWREALEDGGFLNGETENGRRTKFYRIKDHHLKLRNIEIWKEWVWIPLSKHSR